MSSLSIHHEPVQPPPVPVKTPPLPGKSDTPPEVPETKKKVITFTQEDMNKVENTEIPTLALLEKLMAENPELKEKGFELKHITSIGTKHVQGEEKVVLDGRGKPVLDETGQVLKKTSMKVEGWTDKNGVVRAKIPLEYSFSLKNASGEEVVLKFSQSQYTNIELPIRGTPQEIIDFQAKMKGIVTAVQMKFGSVTPANIASRVNALCQQKVISVSFKYEDTGASFYGHHVIQKATGAGRMLTITGVSLGIFGSVSLGQMGEKNEKGEYSIGLKHLAPISCDLLNNAEKEREEFEKKAREIVGKPQEKRSSEIRTLLTLSNKVENEKLLNAEIKKAEECLANIQTTELKREEDGHVSASLDILPKWRTAVESPRENSLENIEKRIKETILSLKTEKSKNVPWYMKATKKEHIEHLTSVLDDLRMKRDGFDTIEVLEAKIAEKEEELHDEESRIVYVMKGRQQRKIDGLKKELEELKDMKGKFTNTRTEAFYTKKLLQSEIDKKKKEISTEERKKVHFFKQHHMNKINELKEELKKLEDEMKQPDTALDDRIKRTELALEEYTRHPANILKMFFLGKILQLPTSTYHKLSTELERLKGVKQRKEKIAKARGKTVTAADDEIICLGKNLQELNRARAAINILVNDASCGQDPETKMKLASLQNKFEAAKYAELPGLIKGFAETVEEELKPARTGTQASITAAPVLEDTEVVPIRWPDWVGSSTPHTSTDQPPPSSDASSSVSSD
jgi:hypothetical protein